MCSDTVSMVQIELMLGTAALVSCDWLELIKSPPPWKLVEMSGRNVSTGPQLKDYEFQEFRAGLFRGVDG